MLLGCNKINEASTCTCRRFRQMYVFCIQYKEFINKNEFYERSVTKHCAVISPLYCIVFDQQAHLL